MLYSIRQLYIEHKLNLVGFAHQVLNIGLLWFQPLLSSEWQNYNLHLVNRSDLCHKDLERWIVLILYLNLNNLQQTVRLILMWQEDLNLRICFTYKKCLGRKVNVQCPLTKNNL